MDGGSIPDGIYHRKLLRIIQLVLAFAGWIVMIISVRTPYWYLVYTKVSSGNGYFGLLCGGESGNECTSYRDGVLKFKGTTWPIKPIISSDLDLVLLCLVISMITTIFGIISSILLAISRTSRWRYQFAKYMFLMISAGAISGLVAMCHFELKIAINDTSDGTFKHGWSSVTCWISFVLLTFSAVVTVPLLQSESYNHRNNNNNNNTNNTQVAKCWRLACYLCICDWSKQEDTEEPLCQVSPI